jgi:DNA-binding CsgD family transcriptional regulator
MSEDKTLDQVHNHWNLTPAEQEALCMYADHGSAKAAAYYMGKAPKTINVQLASAKEKMEVPTIVRAAVLYDRLRRQTAGAKSVMELNIDGSIQRFIVFPYVLN